VAGEVRAFPMGEKGVFVSVFHVVRQS